ncbi:TrbC family F-type conjugative pilus assembly protein (plasmid) [Aliarcobacter lanthieri]|uniref:TrbC family F-type conjugative pilus assembly protein n=1 Tax=Aliarcobacter lanthieri TaxID=1355374 RepID=UPI003AACF695
MKIILYLVAIVNCVFANYEQLLKPLEDVQNNKYLKDFQEKSNLNKPNEFFNQILLNSKYYDSEGTLNDHIKNEIDKFNDKNKNEKEFKSFTIFYFISENTSKDLIKSFSYEITKLKELDITIDALLLTRGLIGGSFDKMAEYVKSLQDLGIQKIDLSFNPWAYEYFDLQQVPAYALSYCERDYRFKTCNHKYLLRGELSLTNFFEIVSDENQYYKKYYQKLIEAK